jgi:DNA repair protein RAD51/nuclear pore complex protein Nup160
MDEHPLRHFNVQSFIHTLVSQGQVKKLFSYPWSELADSVDKELESKAKKTLSSGRGPEWHKILYAWRVKKGDWRGAAQVAFERLERLRQEAKGNGGDPRDERVVEAYLLLINTMAIIGEKDAWVLHEPVPGMKGLSNGCGKEKEGKRKLVTLEDVRREYAEELDRRAVLEQGRFGFVDEGGDGMDVL